MSMFVAKHRQAHQIIIVSICQREISVSSVVVNSAGRRIGSAEVETFENCVLSIMQNSNKIWYCVKIQMIYLNNSAVIII